MKKFWLILLVFAVAFCTDLHFGSKQPFTTSCFNLKSNLAVNIGK